MNKTLAILIIVFAVISCDTKINFEDWMSCPSEQEETSGDLVWINCEITSGTSPLPGDTIIFSATCQNLYDAAFNESPNIAYASNIRLFMEDTANVNGAGTVGPEDWFIGEFILPGLFADKRHVIVEKIIIPRTDHFPASKIGPQTVEFRIYAMLDAQNCVLERNENNNMSQCLVNGNATLTVSNPNLPNLQIKYVQRTPTSPMNELGGISITEWEVLNSGIGATTEDFDIFVFLSEDDVYDTWDVLIGSVSIDRQLSGNTNTIEYVTVNMPYIVWRNNGWSLYSAVERYDPAIGDVLLTRELPPAGPPGYNFTVYPCMSGGSILIACVDPAHQNNVREAVETDNYSFQGTGGNGGLTAQMPTRPGGADIDIIEFRADNYAGSNNVLDVSLRYNSSIQFADNCSFGFYWSKNDQAQFGDFFCQRYWFQIQPGQNILLYPFGITNVWRPDPLPSPGTYRMVVVADDIYKFDEPNEDNNTEISIGTVQVG